MKANLRVSEAKGLLNSVPFDDEGGVMAMQELVDTAEADWYGRREG